MSNSWMSPLRISSRRTDDVARPGQPRRRFPRTARVNEVVLETLAEELERMSDPRLGFVTLTGVDVSPDLRQAPANIRGSGRAGRARSPPKRLLHAGRSCRGVSAKGVRSTASPVC